MANTRFLLAFLPTLVGCATTSTSEERVHGSETSTLGQLILDLPPSYFQPMFVSGVVFHLPCHPAADYPVGPRKLRDLRLGLHVETDRNISIRVASASAATQAFSAPFLGELHQQVLGNALTVRKPGHGS
jgi:hypothetical protein